MAEKERIGKSYAKTLRIGNVVVPKIASGPLTVTGTGTVTVTGFGAITAVQATLGQNAAATGSIVTATFSGLTATFAVWEPTSVTNPTPVASSTATVVNYLITGN